MTTPLDILQRVFGYDTFHSQQEQVITHILSGKDALVLMPTGGGKSICFQVPALCLDGLTLVVSPLVSLRDQVGAQGNGVAAATSSTSPRTRPRRFWDIANGTVKLLYVSPEKLCRR